LEAEPLVRNVTVKSKNAGKKALKSIQGHSRKVQVDPCHHENFRPCPEEDILPEEDDVRLVNDSRVKADWLVKLDRLVKADRLIGLTPFDSAIGPGLDQEWSVRTSTPKLPGWIHQTLIINLDYIKP